MGRWSRYTDPDADLLPHGMRRIAYDADSSTYTYRDSDGSLWSGAPGARYGELRPLTKSSRPTSKTSHTDKMFDRLERERSDKLTELKSEKDAKRKSTRRKSELPAPPYQSSDRRFTDFGQLDEVRKQEGGLLAQVKRSLSTRSRPSTRDRRGTV